MTIIIYQRKFDERFIACKDEHDTRHQIYVNFKVNARMRSKHETPTQRIFSIPFDILKGYLDEM